jgi:manganese/iron transport system permease protein
MALAVLWGFNLTVGALLTAALMVAGISLVNRRSQLSDDTGVGLLFVGMLALGVIIISKSRSFTTDVQSLLFGDVLGVTWGDIRVQAAAAALVVACSALGYRAFLALSFNEAKAGSLGLRPGLTHFALLALIAVAIVSSFQAVGTLLVFGLLVGPPATAALLVRRVWVCMVVGVALGWLAVVVGLLLSYHHGTAAGATVAGVAVAQFFVVLLVREVAPVIAAWKPGRTQRKGMA